MPARTCNPRDAQVKSLDPTFASLFPDSLQCVPGHAREEGAMRAPLRPYVTAGIGLVGASAIVAPIAATPPDVKIANPDLQLSASPFDPYAPTSRSCSSRLSWTRHFRSPSRTCSTACSTILRPIFKSSSKTSRISDLSCNWTCRACWAMRPTTFDPRSTAQRGQDEGAVAVDPVTASPLLRVGVQGRQKCGDRVGR